MSRGHIRRAVLKQTYYDWEYRSAGEELLILWKKVVTDHQDCKIEKHVVKQTYVKATIPFPISHNSTKILLEPSSCKI